MNCTCNYTGEDRSIYHNSSPALKESKQSIPTFEIGGLTGCRISLGRSDIFYFQIGDWYFRQITHFEAIDLNRFEASKILNRYLKNGP
jgi:hypothetical protein